MVIHWGRSWSPRAEQMSGTSRCLTKPALAAQTVKMGVQYSLWGGSVMNLGTERHRQQYFEAIDKYKLPGRS